MIYKKRKTVVVIGNGMVGHRFCERLVEFDEDRDFEIVVFGEETRPVYDRVHLTQWFAHRDGQQLQIAGADWYEDHQIALFLGDPVKSIDHENQVVRSANGREVTFDLIVFATGSAPFVPSVPGVDKAGVFVYRTIDDLEKITECAASAKRRAVIGGGLLGLEAAKAAYDLGLETHVVEFASRLMPRQVDEAGSKALVGKIESLGVKVHLNKNTKEIAGSERVEAMVFADGSRLDVDMIIVSAGIKPRDDLARSSGITVGARGGIIVDANLRTSMPHIFAIGEVALSGGMIYGLIAPGYEMAETLAAFLTGSERTFTGSDLSTKLKLMGVDVASFGNPFTEDKTARNLLFEDSFAGVYKKLVFNHDGTKLLGGILVGDASDYGTFLALYKSSKPLTVTPSDLLVGKRDGAAGGNAQLPDDAQICSCNNVSKAAICSAIVDRGLMSVAEVKSCTKAGAGCGGCLPLVTDLFKATMAASGKKVNNNLCEHFAYTRQELFDIVKVKGHRSFDALISSHGKGNGCEVCKPAVASMLASLWNDLVLEHSTLQDTNDRFLANMQRGGLYSVVPHVAGGEITPEKLIVLGEVAKKYNLYTKITGGQRIDLFGARLEQLPEIWEVLVKAGFESGHAYGKALRTIKSCVGETWCRYGVQDSVGFAIRLENRYKGIRSPHKLKSAVSGCIRECAEAQSKDFGFIATENGYNLFVCGNGGSKPRHADLLAVDLDEETAVKYLDRFIMYYILTADRLTRTSVWLDKMEGGIDALRDVIVHDKLGIAADLERQIQFLADTYQCEWREVVENPERRRLFRQFMNTDETEPTIEIVSERGQPRPADWAESFVARDSLTLRTDRGNGVPRQNWVKVGRVSDFPKDGGSTIKYGKVQIAVFNFSSRGEWFASQNMCPHRREFVLSRGIIGDQAGTPKVACPLHKKTFSLETGECLSGDDYSIRTFPVKVDREDVFLELPALGELDVELATDITRNTSCRELAMA